MTLKLQRKNFGNQSKLRKQWGRGKKKMPTLHCKFHKMEKVRTIEATLWECS